VCKNQNKDDENERTHLTLELDTLRTMLATKQSELDEREIGASRLNEELVTVRLELSKALDKISRHDATILDLNEQLTLLQHEVRFLNLYKTIVRPYLEYANQV